MAGDPGGGAGLSDEISPISSINVTPFVDVVLVLLVIFMVTAPVLMTDAIGIHLPKAQSGDQTLSTSLGIAVTKNGQILLNGQPVAPEALATEVRQALERDREAQAIISADADARHADVVR